MRKLATIRIVDQILPIEGADAIVLVKIQGWQCVALKTEFKVGDPCVYFEIDSWIPRMPQIEHLYARANKIFNGKEGIRIKTIKLRGQLSQGLALPVSSFGLSANVGDDVSAAIGVEKWEPPIPAQLGGQVHGNFPGFIQKTDQDRCQNMVSEIFLYNKDSRYEVTMKLDGTSFTAFFKDGEDGVCGRNWQLDINEENVNNSLVRMYVDSGLQFALQGLGKNYAVQGELMGPGIQKNRESLLRHKLYIFDIYDIDNMKYLTPYERQNTLQDLYVLGLKKDFVDHVPVLMFGNTLEELGITDIDTLLRYAEGPSIVHPNREGLVFKRVDGEFSFKSISNKFLLKEED